MLLVQGEHLRGATIRILGGGGGVAGVFWEINIFVGKMGEINKWPQGMVEIIFYPHRRLK